MADSDLASTLAGVAMIKSSSRFFDEGAVRSREGKGCVVNRQEACCPNKDEMGCQDGRP